MKEASPRWGVPKASDLSLLARNKYRRHSRAPVRRLSERVDPTQLHADWKSTCVLQVPNSCGAGGIRIRVLLFWG